MLISHKWVNAWVICQNGLLQERWQCSGTPVMCTASLVDAYAAMADTAEEHGTLAAVHPSYAAMLERVLVQVAHQHVTKLEAFAQVQQASRASHVLLSHLIRPLSVSTCAWPDKSELAVA